MPMAVLYQTGSTTRRGGSISGGPGTQCRATVMLRDFGSAIERVGQRMLLPAK